MRTKQFKAESKKLLEMMINSIYTHKEIFLRELISNASDALDKLYFQVLTDDSIKISRDELEINIIANKETRTLTITDNGIGMTAEELEANLGTIAKSGSLAFKRDNAPQEDVSIIGQFGVGFYSAFMVADKVVVESKAFGSEEAHRWTSEGVKGYYIEPCEKAERGTVITLYIKPNTDEESFEEYMETSKLTGIIKKYSDYVRYPIKMDVKTVRRKEVAEGEEKQFETVVENQVINSMIPLWKKNRDEITNEEYNNFYKEKFYDIEDSARVIHSRAEGMVSYDALLFVPKNAPYNFYTKEYKKGLQLYSNGILIMENCEDLLPDYFGFVKGLVDTEDISLNISREMLQHNGILKQIARALEKTIKSELYNMLNNDRENYDHFFKEFGLPLKYGICNDYGMHRDTLGDLMMFHSSTMNKLVTLFEYVDNMKEGQDAIFYAMGPSNEKIELNPQTEQVKQKGYEILYMTDYADEFVIRIIGEYEGKKFTNINSSSFDISTEDEKKELSEANKDNKDMFGDMKKAIGEAIYSVRFTNKLVSQPVCLTTYGDLSLEMEKVLNAMPNDSDQKPKARVMLDININHPIAEKLKDVYAKDAEAIGKYARVLYAQACLISGVPIDNPTEISNLMCEIMVG